MSTDARVTSRALALLFGQAKTALTSSLALCLILLAHEWDVPVWQQWAWAITVNVISLGRFLLARSYLALPEAEQRRDVRAWVRRAMVGTFIAGVSWAVGLGVGVLQHDFGTRMFTLALSCGLLAGSMGANFAVRNAFYAFSAPVLLVLVTCTAVRLDSREAVLAMLGLLLIIFTVLRTARLVSDSIAVNLGLVEWQRNAMLELEATRDAATMAARSRSDFIAVMSHEIRTPLNGVVGMTALLERTRLDAEQRDSIEVIKTSADALLGLVNDILDLSKIDAGGLQLETASVELHDELSRLMRLFEPRARDKGLEFELLVAPDVPRFVVLDWARVRQVLINLMGNAVKFTPAGFARCRVTVREGQLRFEVQDSGVGMSESAVSRLFTPFTQADRCTGASVARGSACRSAARWRG